MPTEYSNFSNPDDPDAPPEHYREQGGQHLDGNGQWMGGSRVTEEEARRGQNGQSNVGYNPRTGISDINPETTTGNIADPYAWGGSSGQVVLGPDGKPMIDTSRSGRANDERRFRGMGNEAANRQAYQLNYGKGDVDRAAAQRSRGAQAQAVGALGNAARGLAPSRAVIQGQGMVDATLEQQLAGQGGTKGIAATGAAGRAGAGAAAQQQLGVADHLGGMRSGELTAARGLYGQGAGAMRTQDYAAQNLSQDRAKAKYASEFGQRQLNSADQRDYERMAFDTNVNAQNAGLKEEERAAGIYAASLAREGRDKDAMAQMFKGSITTAGQLGKSALDDDDKDK